MPAIFVESLGSAGLQPSSATVSLSQPSSSSLERSVCQSRPLPRDKMGWLACGRSQLEGAKTAHVNTWIQPEGEKEINSDFTPPGRRDPATAPTAPYPIPCAAQAQLAAALHLLHPIAPLARVDGPWRSVQAPSDRHPSATGRPIPRGQCRSPDAATRASRCPGRAVPKPRLDLVPRQCVTPPSSFRPPRRAARSRSPTARDIFSSLRPGA